MSSHRKTLVIARSVRSAAVPTLLAVGWTAMFCLSSSAFAADWSAAKKYLAEGRYEEAAAEAKSGLEVSRRDERWWLMLLESQLAVGEYEEAMGHLENALVALPASIRIRWVGRDVARFNNAPERADALIREIERQLQTESWRYRSSMNLIAAGRFLLERGADPKSILDGVFASARRSQVAEPDALKASGELALAKDDFALAAEFFEDAARLRPEDAAALHGLARAYAPSDPKKADEATARALAANPRHVPSLLMVADRHVDREQYDKAEAALDEALRINPRHALAWAYRAVLAHLKNEPEQEAEAVTRALATWSTNPNVEHLIGRKLSQKYRFAEGAEHQRRALAFDPDFKPARIQLSQDLLRLGEEAEGWALAAAVSESDPYDVLAYNLATLRDELTEYHVLELGRFRVRMDRREASLYGSRVLALLEDAEAKLAARYECELPEIVSVDIYPRQQDFAIRTFGLPGGAGFLGVCFGPVITMNSPASQGGTPSNWESVLWHEFTHTVTLTKTKNRMPRWLSEGISVHEERRADPTWGQAMSPTFKTMIAEELTPVGRLSGAFLSPPSPTHLQFAYYESSLVVEYLVEEFGFESLLGVLDSLADGLAINDALERHTTDLNSLERGFAEYAGALADAYAPGADFSDLELSPRAGEAELETVLRERPGHVATLVRLARSRLRAGETEAAYRTVGKVLELFGESSPPTEVLTLKGNIEQRLDRTEDRLETLRRITETDSDAAGPCRELMEQAAAESDWPAAAEYAEKLLAVNPLIEPPHQVLATAAEEQSDPDAAIAALSALSVLEPSDPAGLNFRLAELHRQVGQTENARRHVLMSLEEAPRYRAAHRLLLSLPPGEPIRLEGEASSANDPGTRTEASP